MAKQVSIANMTDDQLQTALSEAVCKFEAGVIRWQNAEKTDRSSCYANFNHTGKIVAVKDTEAWRSAIAVQLKVESERRNGGDMVSVKAGYQRKADTASVTVRTTGLKAAESTVTCQLATAQGLAERIRKIHVEIAGREERARQAAEIAEAVEAAKLAKAEADELTAEAASYAVAEAVESGDVPVSEVEALNAELVAA